MATPTTGSAGVSGGAPIQNMGIQTRGALALDPYSIAAEEVYTLGSQVVTAWPTVITHNLHSGNAKLTGAYGYHATGWYVKISVLSKTADTMTISGDVPPPAGGGVLEWRVQDT